MLVCVFCLRDEKSKNSKVQHEMYCQANPNKKNKKPSYGMLGKKGSNAHIKGTAKPMTEEHKESIRLANKNRIWTAEKRANQSESMKRAVEKHPESYTSSNRGRTKQIIYKGIKLQGGWELSFYKWCESNNIDCERNTQGFKYEWRGTRTYYPDFYLPAYDSYVEVKGYKTDRDTAKWSYFPKQLIVIQKQDIIQINTNSYKLPL